MAASPEQVPILVHCHLRWDFVWQRPQQIFSRLAAHHPILFLEAGKDGEGGPRLELSEPARNIVRAVPILPGLDSMAIESQCEIVLNLLESARRRHALLRGKFDR